MQNFALAPPEGSTYYGQSVNDNYAIVVLFESEVSFIIQSIDNSGTLYKEYTFIDSSGIASNILCNNNYMFYTAYNNDLDKLYLHCYDINFENNELWNVSSDISTNPESAFDEITVNNNYNFMKIMSSLNSDSYYPIVSTLAFINMTGINVYNYHSLYDIYSNTGSANSNFVFIIVNTLFGNIFYALQINNYQTNTALYSYTITPTPEFSTWTTYTTAKMNEGVYYNYTGSIVSTVTQYGVANYTCYKTNAYYMDSTALQTIYYNYVASDLNLGYYTQFQSGTVSVNNEFYSNSGKLSFLINMSYNSNYQFIFQGLKIIGTIASTGETFISYLIMRFEPTTDNIIQIYVTGGDLQNYKLIANNFNHLAYNVQYNASGYVWYNGAYDTIDSTITIESTNIVNDMQLVQNISFSNSITLTLTNGQFTFLISAEAFKSLNTYQGLRIHADALNETVIYYIYFSGYSGGTIPTPYPSTSSGVINPTPTSSIDMTQYIMMFILIFVPSLFVAAVCYEANEKTMLHIPPFMGFFAGLCIMVPIGYLTPYNGGSLVPLWMLFMFVLVLVVMAILIFKPIVTSRGE